MKGISKKFWDKLIIFNRFVFIDSLRAQTYFRLSLACAENIFDGDKQNLSSYAAYAWIRNASWHLRHYVYNYFRRTSAFAGRLHYWGCGTVPVFAWDDPWTWLQYTGRPLMGHFPWYLWRLSPRRDSRHCTQSSDSGLWILHSALWTPDLKMKYVTK